MPAIASANLVLEVKDLVKTYPAKRGNPEVRANQGISLTLRAGEVVAVLGPNGAGKTTFVKQVAGQMLPTSGSIQVCGVDVVKDPRRAKENFSVIPQECEPMASLTVEEHLRYFGVIKGVGGSASVEQTARILRQLGLEPHRRKLVRELSGGLKRRVLFGVALSGGEHPLLVLDEPTTGLDPEARRTLWGVIEGLSGAGHSILLTTHYIEEAEVLADRVVIIAQGRIVESGTPHEIQARHAPGGRLDVFGTDRIGPEARRYVDELQRRWTPLRPREEQLRLSVPDPFAPEAVQALAELNRLGVKAALAPSSLEDAYLKIVGEAGTA